MIAAVESHIFATRLNLADSRAMALAILYQDAAIKQLEDVLRTQDPDAWDFVMGRVVQLVDDADDSTMPEIVRDAAIAGYLWCLRGLDEDRLKQLVAYVRQRPRMWWSLVVADEILRPNPTKPAQTYIPECAEEHLALVMVKSLDP